MSNHIESLGDRQNRMQEELKKLRDEIEGVGAQHADINEAAATDDEKAKEVEDARGLHQRLAALPDKIADRITQWRAGYNLDTDIDGGTTTYGQALDTAQEKLNARIADILSSNVDSFEQAKDLRLELKTLQEDVEDASGNDLDQVLDKAKEALSKAAPNSLEIEDAMTQDQIEEADGGGLGKIMKVVEKLMDLYSELQLKFGPALDRLVCMQEGQSCINERKSQRDALEQDLDARRGPQELRNLFAKELKAHDVDLRRGAGDELAFARIKEIEKTTRKPRSQIVKEIVQEYATDPSLGFVPNHIVTMYGMLEGQKSIEGSVTFFDREDTIAIVGPPAKNFDVAANEKTISVNGTTLTIKPDDFTFYGAEWTKVGGNVLEIFFKGGNLLSGAKDSIRLEGDAAIVAFLEKAETGVIDPRIVEKSTFGFRKQEVVVEFTS